MKGHTYEQFEQQIAAIRTLSMSVMDGIQANRILNHKQKAELQSFLSAVCVVVSEQATSMQKLEIERHHKAA